MKTINFTWAKNNFGEILDKVCDDAPLIITRNNQQHVISISLEDYQAMEETAYLLGNPRNALRLMASILELESMDGQERELLKDDRPNC